MVTKYWRKYWQKQTIFSNFVQSKKALFPTEELNESCWSPMTGGGTVFDGYITHPPRGHSMHMSYSRKMIMSMTAAHILAKIGSTLMSVSCTRIRVARLDERTPNASITYGGRSYSSLWGDLDVLVDGAGLLDVGHLPDEGDGAEDGGEDGAGHVPRFLAVEVALQQPGERFLQQRFKVSQLFKFKLASLQWTCLLGNSVASLRLARMTVGGTLHCTFQAWQLLLLFGKSFNCVSSTQDCVQHCVEVGNLRRQADAKQTTNRTVEKISLFQLIKAFYFA